MFKSMLNCDDTRSTFFYLFSWLFAFYLLGNSKLQTLVNPRGVDARSEEVCRTSLQDM